MRRFVILLLLILLAPMPAFARGDEALALLDKLNQRLDRAHNEIEEVEKALADPKLSDSALRGLRARLEPLPREFEETIDTLTPRLTAIQERLKELERKPEEQPKVEEKPAEAAKPVEPSKPAPLPPSRPAGKPGQKPADKPVDKTIEAAPPTAAPNDGASAAEAELAEQRQLFEGADATLKRARSLLLEARQLAVMIVARQRELFAKTLFLRTDGLFSPSLWRAALSDAPAVASAAAGFLYDRAANFVSRVQAGNAIGFIALVLAIFLVIPPALLVARRVGTRSDAVTAPTAVRKAVSAAWATVVVAVVPVAAIAALGLVFDSFDLLDATVEPIWRRVVEAVARTAVTYAIARGVLSPAHPNWRLVDPGDRLSNLLTRLLTLAAAVLSIARLVEQIEETVQASLPVVIVTRGVGVMLISALVAYGVARLPRPDAPAGETDEAVATREGRDWIAMSRFFGIASIVLLVGACAAGYVTFANFLVLMAGWVAAVGATVYLVAMLARGGVEATLEPTSFVGRHLISGLGVRREQLAPLAVLLTGLISLLAYVVGALLFVAPLGYESGDFLANVTRAFFSIKIGEVTLSPSAILTAIGIFAGVLALAQALRRWLDARFLPLTRLDLGLRNSISSTVGYAGFLLAAGMALSHVGIGVEKLAIVAGALSVGIGFGLQAIVGNFVSGLILLWERAIRVGDWIVVGDEQGYVKRINVRSTEIETFDRATMIVPNTNLITGVVKNWLRGDRVGRIKVALTFRANVDPERVRDILLAAARAQEGVLRIPAPQVMFLGMEASGFKFELWCYVNDVEKSARARSDLYFALHRQLSEAGIGFAESPTAPPPTIVQFPSLDKVAAAAAASALAIESGLLQTEEKPAEEPRQETERAEVDA